MSNQPNLPLKVILTKLEDYRRKDESKWADSLTQPEAIDAIYAAGLSAIGLDRNNKYYGQQEDGIRNDLRAEQRKAWQRVCYGEEK